MTAATISAQASQDARLGAAVTRRFSNSVAIFDTGAEVEGLFERRLSLAAMGGLGMASRDITFECITAELPAWVTDGTVFNVAMGDAPTVPLGPYRVQRGGVIVDYEERTTALALELA